MSAFTDLLARHIPYASTRRSGVQCLGCLDGTGNGEYPDTAGWAAHVETELTRAGLRVTKRPPAPEPIAAALFGVSE